MFIDLFHSFFYYHCLLIPLRLKNIDYHASVWKENVLLFFLTMHHHHHHTSLHILYPHPNSVHELLLPPLLTHITSIFLLNRSHTAPLPLLPRRIQAAGPYKNLPSPLPPIPATWDTIGGWWCLNLPPFS